MPFPWGRGGGFKERPAIQALTVVSTKLTLLRLLSSLTIDCHNKKSFKFALPIKLVDACAKARSLSSACRKDNSLI